MTDTVRGVELVARVKAALLLKGTQERSDVLLQELLALNAGLEKDHQLHDVGMAVLPDHVLRKPGKLDPEERAVMETHAAAGAVVLKEAPDRFRSARPHLQLAIDVARHHHERFDGAGYPDCLAGDAIPLAARLVAVVDTYDALRSRRPFRPALPHEVAVRIITEGSPGRFDPALVPLFERCAGRFAQVHRVTAPEGK